MEPLARRQDVNSEDSCCINTSLVNDFGRVSTTSTDVVINIGIEVWVKRLGQLAFSSSINFDFTVLNHGELSVRGVGGPFLGYTFGCAVVMREVMLIVHALTASTPDIGVNV